jgi:hypothetical protein
MTLVWAPHNRYCWSQELEELEQRLQGSRAAAARQQDAAAAQQAAARGAHPKAL